MSKIFEQHPKLVEYFKTSDGTAFFTESDAKNHAKGLENKAVLSVKNPKLVDVAHEEVTQDDTTDAENQAKADAAAKVAEADAKADAVAKVAEADAKADATAKVAEADAKADAAAKVAEADAKANVEGGEVGEAEAEAKVKPVNPKK